MIMTINDKSIDGYIASRLLDIFPSLSLDLKTYVTVNIDDLLKKSLNYKKILIFPNIEFIPSIKSKTIQSSNLNKINVQNELFSLHHNISSFINSHSNIQGVNDLVNYYNSIYSVLVKEPSDTRNSFYNVIHTVSEIVRELFYDGKNHSGLFYILSALHIGLKVLKFKASAINVRQNISFKELNRYFEIDGVHTLQCGLEEQCLLEMNDLLFNHNSIKSGIDSVYALSDIISSGNENVREDMNFIIDSIMKIKHRLNEHTIPHSNDTKKSDYIDTLKRITNDDNISNKRFEDIVCGDDMIPMGFSKNEFLNKIRSLNHQLNMDLTTNVNPDLMLNFLGSYDRDYQSMCAYDGRDMIIFIKIDNKKYVVMSRKNISNKLYLYSINTNTVYEVPVGIGYIFKAGDLK